MNRALDARRLAALTAMVVALALAPIVFGGGGCSCNDEDDGLSRWDSDDDTDGDDDIDGDDDVTDDDDDDSGSSGSIVDDTGDAGKYTSLALVDGDGLRPRIAYFHATDGLKYAANDGMNWTLDVVDGNSSEIGLYPSLQLDGGKADDAMIAYYDKSNGALKFAEGATGGWTVSVVDAGTGQGPNESDANVGLYPSLDIAGTGEPAICYYDKTNGILKYAIRADANWTIESVDPAGDSGAFCSLDHHPSTGQAYITYYQGLGDDQGQLMLATGIPGSWGTQPLDTTANVGKWTNIEIDQVGNIHVVYTDDRAKDLRALRRIERPDATWDNPLVVDSAGWVGANASMALDSELRPWVIYHDQDFNDIKLAKRVSDDWQIEPVLNEGAFGFGLSLAVDSSDEIVFSHYDPKEGYLMIYPER